MKRRLARWTLVAGLALASVTAIAIARLRVADRSIVASPPEAVVEGFARELAAHRFDRALPYLSKHLLAQTIPITLEVRVQAIERRAGKLSNVRGMPQWSARTRAYALAALDTERGEPLRLGFGLVREDSGAWRIDELYELGWKPAGVQD